MRDSSMRKFNGRFWIFLFGSLWFNFVLMTWCDLSWGKYLNNLKMSGQENFYKVFYGFSVAKYERALSQKKQKTKYELALLSTIYTMNWMVWIKAKLTHTTQDWTNNEDWCYTWIWIILLWEDPVFICKSHLEHGHKLILIESHLSLAFSLFGSVYSGLWRVDC